MQPSALNKEELKEIKNIIIELLQGSNFDDQVSVTKSTTRGFKQKDYIHLHQFYGNKIVASQNENLKKFRELKEQKISSLSENEKLREIVENIDFEIGYNIGDTLAPLGDTEELTFDAAGHHTVDKDFVVPQGLVTLIDFWATWCGPCQGPMQHNEDMLKKNEENWKGKATIIGISLDESQQDHIQRVNSKDWKRVQHYRLKNGWDDQNEGLKLFGIDGIPFIVLLDRQGKIVFQGHPSSCKIEDEINRLILQSESSESQDQQVQSVVEVQNQKDNEHKLNKAFLKNEWQQFTDKKDKINGTLGLTLQNQYQFTSNGQKTKISYGKIEVKYNLEVQDKDWIQEGLNLLQKRGPENIEIKQQIINDPVNDKKDHLNFFLQIIQENKLPIEIVEKSKYSLEFVKGKFVETNTSIFTQSKKLHPKYSSELEKINQAIKQYSKKNNERNFEQFSELGQGLKSSLSVGDQYFQIGNLQQFGKTETSVIDHVEGQVLVIDFWAFWCGPCVQGMKKNSILLKKKQEQWKGKVRFVAISLEGEEESKDSFAKNPDWLENIEQNFMKDGRQNIAPTAYGVRYIPHYVIVDKKGLISHLGSCSNIEETIDKLINKEENVDNLQVQKNDIKDLDKQLDQLKKSQLDDLTNNLSQVDDETFQFSFTLNKILTFNQQTGESSHNEIESVNLNVWIREDNYHLIQNSLDQISSIVPAELINKKIEVSKTFDIPFPGSKCELCQKSLNDQTPQYYSHWQKVFYCTDCAESDDKEQVGLARYKVNDSLVFINAPLSDLSVLKSIDEYKFGKNLKISAGDLGSQEHPMMCNGCSSNSNGPRYIALSCRKGYPKNGGFVDICQLCFEKVKARDTQDALKIYQENKKEQLTVDTTYIRILFNHGYYDF